MRRTRQEDSLEGEGATMRATASPQEADVVSRNTSNTSLASGPDVYEDEMNTQKVVESEKPAVGLQQAKFVPSYTSDDALLACNPKEAKQTVSLGQERRRSSLELALAKGKLHQGSRQHYSDFPSGSFNNEDRGGCEEDACSDGSINEYHNNSEELLHQEYSSNEDDDEAELPKGITRRDWTFRMSSFLTSIRWNREKRGVTSSLPSLRFSHYCHMCSLQLVRTVNKAIGRGFLPLQAKSKYVEEEGNNKTLPTTRKQIDETAANHILSAKIMHADGLSEDMYMARLMVVQHLLDRTTGQYLSISSPGAEAISTGQEGIVKCIPPVRTRSIVMRKNMKRAKWDEVLLSDLNFKSFLSSNVLMLFDLLDTEVMHQGKIHSLAWGFLHLENIGSEILNLEQNEERQPFQVTLQLYKTYPLKATETFEAKRAGLLYTSDNSAPPPPPVFLQYLLRCKTKCRGTLKVEISPHVRQEVTIPMHMATDGAQKGEDMVDLTNDTFKNDTDSEKKLAKERRLRGPNEKCLLPTHLLHRLRAGPGGASCITFCPSGNLLAFAACDEPLPGSNCVVIANPDSGASCALLHGHCAIVYSLSFSSDGRRLLSASGDGTARMWCQKETRSNVVLQHTPPTFVYAGVFTPRTHFPTPLPSFATLSDFGGVQQRLITPDFEMIPVMTAGFDGKIIMWNANNGTNLGSLKRDERGVIVVWRSTGGGSNCSHPEGFSVLRRIRHPDIADRSITSLTLIPKRNRGQLLVGAHGSVLRLFDLSTYKPTHDGFSGCSTGTSMIGACCSPDGQVIASGAQDGRLRLWYSSTGSRIQARAATATLNTSLRAVAWHLTQHVVALAGMGIDAAVLLYCAEKTKGFGEEDGSLQDQTNGKRVGTSEKQHVAMPPPEAGVLDPVQQAAESRRREENRQRLREMRIQRLYDRAERMGYHQKVSTTTAVPVVLTRDTANPIHAAAVTTKKPEPGIIGNDNATQELST